MTEWIAQLSDRIARKIYVNGNCWLWMASLNNQGYGLVAWKRSSGKWKMAYAHRIIYELLKGAIPQGSELDHLCRVRHCVNPAHLEIVTHRVNVLRGTGAPARHAAKTHCPRGHPYDMTVQRTARKFPSRRCSICHYAEMKKRQATAGGGVLQGKHAEGV